MAPIPVLYVDYYKEYGGGQISLLGILRNLDRKRWRPSLVVNHEGRLSNLARSAGAAVHVIPMGKGKWRYFWKAWPAYKQLFEFGRGQQAKIVHANGFFAATLAGPVALRLGAKALWHKRIHVDKRKNSSTALGWRFYSSFFDRMLAVSSAVGHNLERIGISKKKIHVIPNFVDDTFLKGAKALSSAQRRELDLPKKAPLIGVIAARRYHKGLDLFLKAAVRLCQNWRGKGEAPIFVMIGDVASGEEPYEEKLQRLQDSPRLRDRLRIVPFSDQIAAWYKTLNLVVCPSRREGFGRVAVEAMMAGCPVVASYPEAVEIIEHGKTGLLSAPGYVDELVKVMELALRDRQGTQRRAEAGQKDAHARFGAKRYMKALEEVYDELL